MAVAAFTKDSNKTIPKLDGFKPSSLGHDTDAMESAERFIVLNLARDLSQEHRPEACAPSGHFVRLPFVPVQFSRGYRFTALSNPVAQPKAAMIQRLRRETHTAP